MPETEKTTTKNTTVVEVHSLLRITLRDYVSMTANHDEPKRDAREVPQ